MAENEKLPKGPAENEKLPKGLHEFYRADKFTDASFWFMCGLIHKAGMSQYEAANAFREFMQLDEDTAPTRSLMRKYIRHKVLYHEVLRNEKSEINATFRRDNRKNIRTDRRR